MSDGMREVVDQQTVIHFSTVMETLIFT